MTGTVMVLGSPPHPSRLRDISFWCGLLHCSPRRGSGAGLGYWELCLCLQRRGNKVRDFPLFLPPAPPPSPSLSSLFFYVSRCLCRASAAPCLLTPCTNVLITAVKSWVGEEDEEEEGARGAAGGGSARPCAEVPVRWPGPWGGSERRLLRVCVCVAEGGFFL